MTSKEPAPGQDSRVEDWFGQSVDRDAELADELAEEESAEDAERHFDERATGEVTIRDLGTRHQERVPRAGAPGWMAARAGRARADTGASSAASGAQDYDERKVDWFSNGRTTRQSGKNAHVRRPSVVGCRLRGRTPRLGSPHS